MRTKTDHLDEWAGNLLGMLLLREEGEAYKAARDADLAYIEELHAKNLAEVKQTLEEAFKTLQGVVDDYNALDKSFGNELNRGFKQGQREAYEDAAKMADDTAKACLSSGCGCDPKYCSCRVVNEAASSELESLADELRQKAGKL